MNARSIVVTSVIASVLLSESVHAQGSSAYLASIGTKAVDAKGVRHNGDDYPQRHPPWLDDLIKGVAPEYPIWDRAQRHQGMGLFQLTLDLKTGAVMAVSVTKSTGFKTLDNRAIAALRQWRWKPGKWKMIDMAVTFSAAMHRHLLRAERLDCHHGERSSNQSLQRTAGPRTMTRSQHVYEIRPRKDQRGFDLISDALPFGRLWYDEPNAASNAISYAKFFSRSHDAVIRVYDEAGDIIETHEHTGEFKAW